MRNFKQLLIFLFISVPLISGTLYPEVLTQAGKVKGRFTKSVNGRTYASFEGIPYAKPPVGKHRFWDPQPITKWRGVWTADTLYKCIQYFHYTKPGDDFVIGDEDCLYINVYTPNVNQLALLDVIVFIHGGAFMFNAGGTYGPRYLMDRDVVFVSFNYRLGVLGFLSTEDDTVPGNFGLKDQVLALKWVKDNIKFFGGNPNSITLTGMSAGGASVQLHSLSPLSTGLFHRAVIQSGTSLNPWVMNESPLEKSKTLAGWVGCQNENTRDMVDCLKRRPARQIVSATKHFLYWLYNPFSPFGVVVDNAAKQPFLPQHPYMILKTRKVQDVPVIFSTVESEGLYPGSDFIEVVPYLNEIDSKWNELIPHILDFNYTVPKNQKDVVSQKIREFYFKNESITLSSARILIKMISDRMFFTNIEQAAKLHSSAISSNVYFYWFSYRGVHSKSEKKLGNNNNYGASHGDDTVYVLSSEVDTLSTAEDKLMSNLLIDMWTSFANNSVPIVPNLQWPPLEKNVENMNVLKISSPSNIQMEIMNDLGNREFWSSLKFEENELLFNPKEEL